MSTPPRARAGSILRDSPATAPTALPGHKGSILRGDVTLPRSAPRGLGRRRQGSAGSTGRLGPSSQMPPFPVL